MQAAPADAEVTASGLASKVLQTGNGPEKPGSRDFVTVHYSGWTTDGKLFDSSVQRGEPTSFPLNGVIPGWTEGLQLMVVGEKRRFWIPAELAYGENPGGGRPGGLLVFEVELLDFEKAPAKKTVKKASATKVPRKTSTKTTSKKTTRKATKRPAAKKATPQKTPKKVLVIDVGGSNIKLFATGMKERIKIPSGSKMSPKKMIKAVKEVTKDWDYDHISIGIPCAVKNGRAVKEAANLGSGWKNFDLEGAFPQPVKVINDATMQALGCYRSGVMLFLGIGTGLGASIIAEGALIPLEIAHMPYKKKRSYEDYIGKSGLARLGKKKWKKHAKKIIKLLTGFFRK